MKIAPTGVATLVENGGFPIKYKEGTNIPEILSKKKEVRIIICFN